MKSVLFALALATLPMLAQASDIDSRNAAIAAYQASPVVAAKKAAVEATGQSVDVHPQAALLGGSCGFVGCSSTYLVTAGHSANGVNEQTKVIAAVVSVWSSGPLPATVRLVEITEFIQ